MAKFLTLTISHPVSRTLKPHDTSPAAVTLKSLTPKSKGLVKPSTYRRLPRSLAWALCRSLTWARCCCCTLQALPSSPPLSTLLSLHTTSIVVIEASPSSKLATLLLLHASPSPKPRLIGSFMPVICSLVSINFLLFFINLWLFSFSS